MVAASVIVIGSINLDLTATVARLPNPGETVPGKTFKSAPGGKGANQALAAARAGASVRMIGAVGKDGFATEALALLKKGKVDLSCVAEMHAPTGTALILVGDDGENVIAVVPGANAAVLPGDLVKADLKAGDILLLQHEIPLETVEAALDAARNVGAISLLNTAPYQADAGGMLGKADYIIANQGEFDLYAAALGLAGGDRDARMKAFCKQTGRTLVVTLGAGGVIALTPQETFEVAALKITPVDTVGAGDTFCGYLGAALGAGHDLETALRRASVAGSLACLTRGAQPSIPTAAAVDQAIATGKAELPK